MGVKQGFEQCDHVSRTCKTGCEKGYVGPLCSTYSKDKAIDNNPSTTPDSCDCCSQTADGWWMIDLVKKYFIQAIQIIGRSDECTQGTYGLNCAEKCGNCGDGVFCNTQNGHCPSGCERGSQGAKCKNDCPFAGSFGDSCRGKCHCSDGQKCDILTGKCSSPGCLQGWSGAAFKTCCDKQTFGVNCENECHCYECDDVDGSCGLYPCFSGWGGGTCSEPINKRKEDQNDQNHYTVPGASMSSDYATLDVAESEFL
ncbi:protein draper-like [Mya arenaria]|uniref:protein draper-like n=1 Tax=Mya arenaria TaxID=6604 RepID=UPI0022E33C53|nr:protein draper-like [Mya arenaria]